MVLRCVELLIGTGKQYKWFQIKSNAKNNKCTEITHKCKFCSIR